MKHLLLISATMLLFSCQKNELTNSSATTSMIGNTELTVYGVVTSKVVQIDDSHAQIIVQKNGKILDLRSVKTPTGISIQSTTGLVYYTQEDNTGVIVDKNEIPFSLIGITPQPSIYSCLKRAVALCKSSGFCKGIYFTNIFGVTSFSFGMTLKCALGY